MPVFRDDDENGILGEVGWVNHDVMIEEAGEPSCTVEYGVWLEL